MSRVYVDTWFFEGTICDSAHLRAMREAFGSGPIRCACGHGRLRHAHPGGLRLGPCEIGGCLCAEFAAPPEPVYPCDRCGATQLPENLDEDGCCDMFTRGGHCAAMAKRDELEEAEDVG